MSEAASPVRSTRAALKAAELRRMQRLATALLAAMLCLLLGCTLLQAQAARLPPLLVACAEWVRAFAEAGAIGALADWYAVVALFRRPLGLPVPHTAIIQRRKDEIGVGIGQFVEEHFLTPQNIVDRLAEHSAGRALAGWLADAGNSRAVADSLAGVVPGLLDALQDDDLARFLDRALAPQLMRLDASKLAGDILALLTSAERHQPLLERGARAVEDWLAANRAFIAGKFGEASRYTPAALDKYIVDRFVAGVVALLHEVTSDPQHPLRLQFDAAVRGFVVDLRTSPAYRAQGRALVADFLEHLRRERYWRTLWRGLRRRLAADLASERSTVKTQIAAGLQFLGRELLADAAVQAKLDAWWLATARRVVMRFRHQVSALIAEVVRRWDGQDISRRVELEIGKDLQYIRVNGTLVGGLAGVLLHGLTRLVAG